MQKTLAPAVGGWTGYPVGFAAAVVVTAAAVAAHGTAHPLWALGALTVTTAAVSAFVTLRAALATAAVTWAFDAGFILGRHGELALTPAAAAAAAVLAGAAVLTYGAALGLRYAQWRALAAAIRSSRSWPGPGPGVAGTMAGTAPGP